MFRLWSPVLKSARDSASLFGEPTGIVEAKNEGRVRGLLRWIEDAHQLPIGRAPFVTVTDQPFDFCGPEADALKEAVRDKTKFNADEISRFLNSIE